MAEEQRKQQEGEAVFDYLMRIMPSDDLQKKIDEAEKKQSRFYKFKEGKQNIIISKIPTVIIDSDRFQYSDGVGYVGVVKEMNDGIVGKTEFPITFTGPQFWEIVGQVRVNFPEWTPNVDRKMEVIDGIKIIAETNTWKDSVTNEDRSKTRFEIDRKYERYEERKKWLKEIIEEVKIKDESRRMGEATKQLNL